MFSILKRSKRMLARQLVKDRAKPRSHRRNYLPVLEPLEIREVLSGGVSVAVGDVNGDGFADIVTSSGPGGGPHVRVFSGADGAELQSFFAYDPSFGGGVKIALGDVNRDGAKDIIAAPWIGGGPHIKVFDGKDGSVVQSFFAFDPSFNGGVSLTSKDINGDGFADIIAGAGLGGGPHIRIFSGQDSSELNNFFAYDLSFAGGVNVAAGDVNRDGVVDIITGTGPGGGPHVKVFSGDNLGEIHSFFAYTPGFTGGITVAAGDANRDGFIDITTGAGFGGGPHVRVFDGRNAAELQSFLAFDPLFTGGIVVANGDFNGDGIAEIIVGPGTGGAPHIQAFRMNNVQPLASFFAFGPLATPPASFSSETPKIIATANGVFRNPTGGDNSGVGTNRFASGQGQASVLRFESATIRTEPGELFSLGTLHFFNGTTTNVNSVATGVELAVNVDLGIPGVNIPPLVLQFGIQTTPGSGDPTDPSDADTVFFPTNVKPVIFDVGMRRYSLEFVGFGQVAGNGFRSDSQFHVLETHTANAQLAARITPHALAPGVYVAARDTAFPLVIGTHQYLILVPENPAGFATKFLGDGVTKGIVVGAHNVKQQAGRNRLQVVFMEPSDFEATKEFVNPAKFVSTFTADFSTEVDRVRLTGNIDDKIREILASIQHYIAEEQTNPIFYPTAAQTIGSTDACLNSNSWAQSVIKHNVGVNRVQEDFFGADRCHENRIAQSYFK